MPARHLTPRAPRPTGAVSWVGLAMLGALVAVVYLAWVWVPIYAVHYDVKQEVRAVGNQGVYDTDDAKLAAELSARLQKLAQMQAPGEDGRLVTQPVVSVAAQEITWERTQSPPSLHVAFGYDRPVHYPLLDRWTWKRMEVDMDLDLERPNWNAK